MKTLCNYTVACESNNGKEPLHVKVKFNDGRAYKVSFYSPNMIDGEVSGSSIGCFAMPGLIVVDNVSMKKIREVLNAIVESGYFDRLMPEDE